MSRIRTIKPEFWSDAKIGRLPIGARLLFIGLWNFADDFGVVSASTRRILGEVFEHDESVSESDILDWVESLDKNDMIEIFESDEKKWIFIKNWEKHQKVDKRSQRRNPSPDGKKRVSKGSGSAESRRSLASDSVGETEGEREVEEDHGMGKGNIISLAKASTKNSQDKKKYSQDFEELWTATKGYRRQEDDKASISKKFEKIIKAGIDFEDVKKAVNAWAGMNRSKAPEYRTGLRRFLEVETVRDILENGPPQPPEDDGQSENMRGIRRLIEELDANGGKFKDDPYGLEESEDFDDDDDIQGMIAAGGF